MTNDQRTIQQLNETIKKNAIEIDGALDMSLERDLKISRLMAVLYEIYENCANDPYESHILTVDEYAEIEAIMADEDYQNYIPKEEQLDSM